MVTSIGGTAVKPAVPPSEAEIVVRATEHAGRFAERAAGHDLDASFPFENSRSCRRPDCCR